MEGLVKKLEGKVSLFEKLATCDKSHETKGLFLLEPTKLPCPSGQLDQSTELH